MTFFQGQLFVFFWLSMSIDCLFLFSMSIVCLFLFSRSIECLFCLFSRSIECLFVCFQCQLIVFCLFSRSIDCLFFVFKVNCLSYFVFQEEKILRNNKNYITIDTKTNGVRFHNKAVRELNEEFLQAKEEYGEQQKSVVMEVVNISCMCFNTFTLDWLL